MYNIFAKRRFDEKGYPRFDLKVMFLHSLHKVSKVTLQEYRTGIYAKFLGNLDLIIAEFIEAGYLKKSSFIELVDSMRTIKELKEFLKSKSIKQIGNKPELIIKAIDFFSTQEKDHINTNGKLYAVTKAGWEIIENDNERYKNELSNFEAILSNELVRGNYEKAYISVFEFYSTYPFPISIGGLGILERDKVISEHIMTSDYLTKSMVLSREVNIKMRSIIAVNHLLFNCPNHSKANITNKILQVVPDFECKEIEELLENDETETFEDDEPSGQVADKLFNQRNTVYTFNHAIVMEAYAKTQLSEIMTQKNFYRGISILPGRATCEICLGKRTEYSWEIINSMPVLPRYPGCTCSYIPVVKSN